MGKSFREYIHKIGVGINPDPPCSAGLDVVFIFDYTKSMAPVIEEVKASAADIAAAIETQSNPNSYRLGLVLSDEVNSGSNVNYSASVGYTSLPVAQKDIVTTGATTDQYTTTMELMDTLDNEVSFTNQLNLINTGAFPLGSGVNAPEPLDIALDLVVNSDFAGAFRVNKAKYILIFTDENPSGDDDTYNALDDAKIASLTTDCINRGIRVFVLGAGAQNAVWQNLAINTGGAFNLTFDGEVIISLIVASCTDLIPPVAEAGANQTIELPTNSTTLDASASSDADGTITTYLWELISGAGGGTPDTPNSVTTNIGSLVEGVYTYRLTVTDNDGLQDTDFVTVTVNVAPPPPLVIEDDQVGVGSCTDCRTVTVNVPASETYEIEISKTGSAGYAGSSLIACQTGTNLVGDQTFTITATETFRFGLDASTGNGNSSTSISFVVRDGVGGTVLDNTNLSRTHEDPVINC